MGSGNAYCSDARTGPGRAQTVLSKQRSGAASGPQTLPPHPSLSQRAFLLPRPKATRSPHSY